MFLLFKFNLNLQNFKRQTATTIQNNAATMLGHFDVAAQCINQLNEVGSLQTNAMALVNASIVDYEHKKYGEARAKLESALQIHPDNLEASYNLGLFSLKENDKKLATERFEHLLNKIIISPSVPHSHLYFQLAKLKENNYMWDSSSENAAIPAVLQSYLQVFGVLATDTDARLFNKVASIYEHLQDLQEANQYYNEGYRINPSDINIASSIGSYYIKFQATEKAIYYYERAVLANPNEPNLMLRVASCFRNSYLPPKQYFSLFEKIYNRFPESLACVRALVNITKSYGLTYLNEKYLVEYERLHKIQVERQSDQRYQAQTLYTGISGKDGQGIKGSNLIKQHDSNFVMS